MSYWDGDRQRFYSLDNVEKKKNKSKSCTIWLNEKVEQNPRFYIISYENGWYSDNLNEFYFVIVIITNDKNLK